MFMFLCYFIRIVFDNENLSFIALDLLFKLGLGFDFSSHLSMGLLASIEKSKVYDTFTKMSYVQKISLTLSKTGLKKSIEKEI